MMSGHVGISSSTTLDACTKAPEQPDTISCLLIQLTPKGVVFSFLFHRPKQQLTGHRTHLECCGSYWWFTVGTETQV